MLTKDELLDQLKEWLDDADDQCFSIEVFREQARYILEAEGIIDRENGAKSF